MSPYRGVPGIELVAEPDREPVEAVTMRRPSLSTGPFLVNKSRLMTDGRRS